MPIFGFTVIDAKCALGNEMMIVLASALSDAGGFRGGTCAATTSVDHTLELSSTSCQHKQSVRIDPELKG
jgi:hypothetical protein